MSYTQRHPTTESEAIVMIEWLSKRALVYMEEFNMAIPRADDQSPDIHVTPEWLEHLDGYIQYAQRAHKNLFMECVHAVQTYAAKRNPNHTPSMNQVWVLADFIQTYYTEGMTPPQAAKMRLMFESARRHAQLTGGDGKHRIPDHVDLYEGLQKEEAEER